MPNRLPQSSPIFDSSTWSNESGYGCSSIERCVCLGRAVGLWRKTLSNAWSIFSLGYQPTSFSIRIGFGSESTLSVWLSSWCGDVWSLARNLLFFDRRPVRILVSSWYLIICFISRESLIFLVDRSSLLSWEWWFEPEKSDLQSILENICMQLGSSSNCYF